MNKRVKTYLSAIIILLLTFAGIVFLKSHLVGMVVLEPNLGNGTFENTLHNGSAIILYGNNLTGSYTSEILDANYDSSWNSLTEIGNKLITTNIYLISATHESENITNVFNLDELYSAIDMKDENKRFYLNFSQDLITGDILKIYAKKDKGTIIGIYAKNDSEGNNPLGNFTIDSTTGNWYNITLKNILNSNNALWLGEGTGSGKDPEEYFDYIYAQTISAGNFDFQARSCNLANCSDSEFTNINANILNLTGRYFQYKIIFDNHAENTIPFVKSVSINYSVLNQAPSITLIIPENNETYDSSELDLSFSIEDDNLDSCWYVLNNQNTEFLNPCQSTTINLANGNHTLDLYANDSLGIGSIETVNFSVYEYQEEVEDDDDDTEDSSSSSDPSSSESSSSSITSSVILEENQTSNETKELSLEDKIKETELDLIDLGEEKVDSLKSKITGKISAIIEKAKNNLINTILIVASIVLLALILKGVINLRRKIEITPAEKEKGGIEKEKI